MKKFLLFSFFGIFFCKQSNAQNCTVNAGVDRQVCISQNMTLVGQRNGVLKAGVGITWKQIAGPSITITNPNSLTTTVKGYTVGNVYTFRLSTTCNDGIKIFDDVKFTVVAITKANAGVDQLLCSGIGTLNGNAPGVNETGQWLTVSANNAGVIIANPTNRNSTFTVSPSAAGSTTLRWRIANTNTCTSFDDMIITNYGGRTPVTTNKLIRLDSCYSTTHCANLLGSYGGNGTGNQKGTWTQLSGPTTATIGASINDSSVNACNLIQGRYRFKWTVSGPCINGSDTVLVIVPRSTSSLTGISASSFYFCNGQTNASLSATAPTFVGESAVWTQVAGPSGATITNPTSANTLVTGLDGSSSYTFRYTILNSNTHCTGYADAYIQYVTPPSITFRDTLLPCNIEELTIPINGSGGLNMYYRIATAPSAWGASPTAYSDITGATSLTVNGLNIPGNYVIDVQRTSPSGVGCFNASKSFKVTVSKPVVGANAGTDQFLACNIDSTRLAGNIPDTGFIATWSLLSGPNDILFDSLHLYNSYISGNPFGFERGKYTLRWTISGGPKCTKASDDVILYFAPTIPNPVNAGPNRSVCYGPVVQLDGTPVIPGETGQWTVTPSAGVTIIDPSDPKTFVSGLSPVTAYTFKWKKCNTCGCDSSTVIITTTATLGPPIANAGADRCLASGTTSITLAANNPSPASGKWTKVSGPSITFSNDTLYNTNIIGLVDSNYVLEWKTIRGACDPRRDSLNITVNCTSPPSNAGPDKDSCGNSITMSANTPPYGQGTWVQVSGPAGWSINNVHSPSARITNLSPGSYEFSWVVKNGIASPSIDNVKFNIDIQPSTPDAGVGGKYCNAVGVVTLSGNALTDISSSAWSLLSPAPNSPNIISPDAQSTQVTGMISGIYKFRYTAYSIMGICPAKYDDVEDTLIFVANAGRDTGFCDTGSYTLAGTPGSIGTWTKLSGGSATLTVIGNNTAILSNAGSAGSPYKFIYSIPTTFGCPPSKDTVTIVYSDTSSNPNAGPDQKLCNATTFNMNGNALTPPSSGLWTFLLGPNTPTITAPANPATSITGVIPGIYLFNWKSTNQYCVVQDQVKIAIDAAPSPAKAGADRTLCPDTVKMNAGLITSGTGLWSQISGPNTALISNTSDPKTSISNITQGTYKFEWRVISGVCAPNIDTVQINIPNLKPTKALAGIDSVICNRTLTKFNANSPSIGSGNWQQLSGPSSTIASSSSNTSNLTLSGPGNFVYAWNIVNGICSSSDTVNVSMTLPPTTANAGKDSTICVYAAFKLYANSPTIGLGNWTQVSGSSSVSFDDSALNNTVIYGLATGNYSLKWSITSGVCPVSSDNVSLVVLPAPSTAIAGPSQTLCAPFTTLNGSTNTIGSALWQNVSGPNVPVIVSPTLPTTNVNALTNGYYKFRYSISSSTCVDEDTINVQYLPPSPNDKCVDAKILLNPNPIANDSLCGARPQIGEPNTCGFAPCNSVFYKFKTNPSLWYKDVTVNFTNIGACINGLRVSMFNDGACPTLGTQHKTCQTITSPGSLVFTDLAPSTNYYMIVDENTAVCSYSKCNYTFEITGEPLPIEWNNVSATLSNNTYSKIKWQTTNEINTKEFILERSIDGSKFTNIATIKSKNSAQMSQYEYVDNIGNLESGRIYYRIKEVDFNAKVNISRIVYVNKQASFISNVSITPNPSNGIYNVSLNLQDDSEVKLKIVNAFGQEVINNFNTLTKGSNSLKLDLSNYTEGIYFIHIIGKDSVITEKIILVK